MVLLAVLNQKPGCATAATSVHAAQLLCTPLQWKLPSSEGRGLLGRGLLQLLTLFGQRAGDMEDAQQVGVGRHCGSEAIGLSRDSVGTKPAGGGSQMIGDGCDAGEVLSFQ